MYKPKEDCSESKVSEKQLPGRDIASINAQIQGLEGIFWQKVEEGQNAGVKLPLKKSQPNISWLCLKKNSCSFFLYLEYFAIESNVCHGRRVALYL